MIESKGVFVLLLHPNGDIVLKENITKKEYEKINQAGVKFAEIELTKEEKIFIRYETASPFNSIIGKMIKAVVDLATKDLQNIIKHK